MPNPGWNVHWSSELTGSDSNLFETTGWSPWRAPNTLYLTSSPLSGGRCKMYLENPPSGYSTVAAGGYTQDQNINPSSEFNGRGIYRKPLDGSHGLLPHGATIPAHESRRRSCGCFSASPAKQDLVRKP